MTRANSGKESKYPAGEVTVRRVAPTKKATAKKTAPAAEAAPLLFSEAMPEKPATPPTAPPRPRAKRTPVKKPVPVPDWTEEQARDLLYQGYSREQTAKRTGFPLTWVMQQAVPNCSLQDKIAGKG